MVSENVRRKDKKLLIRSEHVNENLVITVQDNGAGMDAESMNRLLDQNDMKTCGIRHFHWNPEC